MIEVADNRQTLKVLSVVQAYFTLQGLQLVVPHWDTEFQRMRVVCLKIEPDFSLVVLIRWAYGK